MTFLPPAEHGRRFRAARDARVAELVSLGVSVRSARAQARNEFAVYDLLEINERHEIRLEGLDLSEPTRDT